jgi:uncharacterized membrane protein (DUF2068 family)
MNTDRGVRAIILYKTVKAVAEGVGAVVFGLLLLFHETEGLHDVAAAIRHHVTGGWAVKLADLIMAGTSHHAIVITVVALTVDCAVTGVEGWALARNHWWGPWLVVVASGALLPIELVELVRKPRIGHLIVLVMNAAIVVYLARKALHEHELRKKLKDPT